VADVTADYVGDVTVADEITNVEVGRPHVVLLGAGASKAALPDGDKNGRSVPLMRELAEDLQLADLFPADLRPLAIRDFEAAYSALHERQSDQLFEIGARIANYFSWLRLPDSPTIYDYLLLCMREKDAVFTFNWDPLIVHARIRLASLGVTRFPKLFFLHGNVAIGYCETDQISGLANRGGIIGQPCSQCGRVFAPSNLMFPVGKKNYQDDPFSIREWHAAHQYLKDCFMFTIFGYSAPSTDVEAIGLLKAAWGEVEERQLEQTEIICRPGSDHEVLRKLWKPFIHTHHYDIIESFFDSWLANHPRRTGEAYWSQYLEAQFIEDNSVPRDASDLAKLREWFRPLIAVEDAHSADC
jgi:hypothetical protein